MKMDFRTKLWLEGHHPVVLLQEKVLGIRRFAYVEMTIQDYVSLAENPVLYKGAACHGRIILSGYGVPSDEQKCFMEEYYEFANVA